MKDPILVIMAAGLGSRFGGSKQITPIDDEGHIILHYTLYDAWKAGFRKIIFVISTAIQNEFRLCVGDNIRHFFNINYVLQDDNCLNEKTNALIKREKPWGTGHAIACCHELIDGPFAVINADDYYGFTAIDQIYKFLSNNQHETSAAMVGYRLGNTLTKNGSVSRGLCHIEGNLLKEITECTKIEKNGHRITGQDDNDKFIELSEDAIISMNCWGFPSFVAEKAKEMFNEFLLSCTEDELCNKEFCLPTIVDLLIKKERLNVTVLTNEEKWCGITYRKDIEHVSSILSALYKQGKYRF